MSGVASAKSIHRIIGLGKTSPEYPPDGKPCTIGGLKVRSMFL
jgi:hypothetical protein